MGSEAQLSLSVGKHLKTFASKTSFKTKTCPFFSYQRPWERGYTNSDIAGVAADIWQNKLVPAFLLSLSFNQLVLARRTRS